MWLKNLLVVYASKVKLLGCVNLVWFGMKVFCIVNANISNFIFDPVIWHGVNFVMRCTYIISP